jgi:hypothetical protein
MWKMGVDVRVLGQGVVTLNGLTGMRLSKAVAPLASLLALS